MTRYSSEERKAVERVLSAGNSLSGFTDKFLGGEEVINFEHEFARYHGCKHGIAVNSGTSALFMALKILGAGDCAIPAIGFTADVAMALEAGLKPVFLDIDSKNLTLQYPTEAPTVIPIHLAGKAVNEDVVKFMINGKTVVIEDCAQCLGGKYPSGEMVGSIGSCSIFSFQETKLMTTLGEGGMILTKNESLANLLRQMRNHGEAYRRTCFPGFNLRMTEVQAAVGREQLKKLPDILEHTRKMAFHVAHNLPDSIIPPSINQYDSPMVLPCRYMDPDKEEFVVKVNDKRKKEFGYPTESDISGFNQRPGRIVSNGVRPLYRIPLFSPYATPCPNAEKFARESLYIDIHRWRSMDEIQRELEILNSV